MPQRRSAAEVVFGMNLEPRDAGPVCADRRVMREAQPDPRPRGDRAARVPVHRGNHGQERLPQEAWVLPPAPICCACTGAARARPIAAAKVALANERFICGPPSWVMPRSRAVTVFDRAGP